MKKVEGRTYTSNTTKLLKHLDKLKIIQEGKPPSPIMAHISIINACNLTCSFCCFANRDLTERLSKEKVFQALESFRKIGVTGVEFTGGGEPTLHPDFIEIVKYANNLGFKLGLCTNGASIGKTRKINSETTKYFSWIRMGMYGFYEGYEYDLSVFEGTDTKVSAAYVWDEAVETSQNPNVSGKWSNPSKKRLSKNFQKTENFIRMIEWVEKNHVPTRIAFNSIKDPKEVYKDIEIIKETLKEYEEKTNKQLEYAFLSDFNYKGERKNNNCYMHMVKPFLFTDGYIYACPSAELSLENNYNYVPESQFKVCSIEEIEEFYSGSPTTRQHACRFCKYAMQNELIDEILTPTEHNEFA
jgi:organic radical activating enzyme